MNKLMRYLLLMMAALLSTSVMAGWDYKGFGGWRTYDQNGVPLQDSSGDEGITLTKNATLSNCKLQCETYGGPVGCQGIEYVDLGGGNINCELHEDKFAYCDTRGGTKTTVGQDGCWVKTAATPTCPSDKWKVITFHLKDKPEIRLQHFPYQGYYMVTDKPDGSAAFDVTTEPDCRIRLQFHENGKYVRTGEPGKSATQLNGNTATVNDASYYNVVPDVNSGMYAFQDSISKNWVGTALFSSSFIYAYDPVLDPANHHFFVTVLQYK